MDRNKLKQLVGTEVAKKIHNDMLIGLGTGSTADAAIAAIGERIASGTLKNVTAAASSRKSASLAESLGIHIVPLESVQSIDLGFDGADEIEAGTLNLIKGGGGAMTLEKRMAKKCRFYIIIADAGKLVHLLGAFPVAVEVIPDQKDQVKNALQTFAMPTAIDLRLTKDGNSPYVTDLGNNILDVHIRPGSIQPDWEQKLNQIPGVIDTGLFLGGYPDQVLIARDNGTIEELQGSGTRSA